MKKSKLKITFVLPFINLTGGIRVHLDYANELFVAGHDIAVVYPLWPYKFQYNFWTQYREFRKILNAPNQVGWFQLKCPLLRVPVIRTSWLPKADVVLAVGWPTVQDVLHLHPSRGRKVHIVMHHESGTGPEKSIRGNYKMPFYRIGYSKAVSAEMQQEFSCEIHEVIPNGVNTELFFPESLPRETRKVLMLYHPDPRKGADDGIKALKELQLRFPELCIELIGPVRPIHSLPGGFQFQFYPSDATLRRHYSSATVLLYPSRVEGFGLPPLEAMACGCPVVSTAVGAVPEFARNGENAFVVQPGDPDGMVDRLTELLRRPVLRNRFSAAGLQTAQQYRLSKVSALFEAAMFRAVQKVSN